MPPNKEQRGGMDIAKGEWVEGELDAMIRRRHDQRVRDEGEHAREQLWVESVRRFHARLENDRRLAWCEHYRRMRAVHWGLGDEYDAKVRELENGHHEEQSA
jgi:hypothetical protein